MSEAETDMPINDQQKNASTDADACPESSGNYASECPSEGDRNIFDERWEMFMDTFGQRCNEHGVKLALAIVVDPQTPQPLVYYKGEVYDLAQLTKLIHRELVDKVVESLTI